MTGLGWTSLTPSADPDLTSLRLSAGDLEIGLLDFGAALSDVRLRGVPHSLILGSPDFSLYRGPLASFGTIIGPVANRLRNGSCEIDGKTFTFEKNQAGRHTLHSASAGTHRKQWQVLSASGDMATLHIRLDDGEGGFPGHRSVTATYRILAPATLVLTVEAETDAPTPMMIAHHPYWNLDGSSDWEGHRLRVLASHYLPCDTDTLPTGEVAPVEGTPFDFRELRELPDDFDNSLCLGQSRVPLRPVAALVGRSGVRLEIATTEPGLQIYDGRGIRPSLPGHDGRDLAPKAGIAIEPQFWPDAPHFAHFPSIILRPGENWRQQTTYTFSA